MRNLLRNIIIASTLNLTITPYLSYAAERNSLVDEDGFSSSVVIQYMYDDNILSDESVIIDANILVVSPEFRLALDKGTNSFEFILAGEMADYDGSSEDNYTDSSFSANGNFEFTSRHRLNLSGLIQNSHDNRGARFSQGDGNSQIEVDEFTDNVLFVVLIAMIQLMIETSLYNVIILRK